jgi:GntR family transcriptional regulator
MARSSRTPSPSWLPKRRPRLGPGDLAVVRRRVRYLDGEPFYSNDSYYPLRIAQGTPLMAPHDIAQGANQALAEDGHVQVRAVDEILVRMPTPDEAARLDDCPLRVVLNILPGDRHVIVYDRPGLPLADNE